MTTPPTPPNIPNFPKPQRPTTPGNPSAKPPMPTAEVPQGAFRPGPAPLDRPGVRPATNPGREQVGRARTAPPGTEADPAGTRSTGQKINDARKQGAQQLKREAAARAADTVAPGAGKVVKAVDNFGDKYSDSNNAAVRKAARTVQAVNPLTSGRDKVKTARERGGDSAAMKQRVVNGAVAIGTGRAPIIIVCVVVAGLLCSVLAISMVASGFGGPGAAGGVRVNGDTLPLVDEDVFASILEAADDNDVPWPVMYALSLAGTEGGRFSPIPGDTADRRPDGGPAIGGFASASFQSSGIGGSCENASTDGLGVGGQYTEGGFFGDRLTITDMAELLAGAGFPPADIPKAIAVATGESGLCTGAVGDVTLVNETWGPSVGLFQIRSLNAEKGTGGSRDIDRLRDPAVNAASAFSLVYGSKGGWNHWSVYKHNLWQKYLPAIEAELRNGPAPAAPPTTIPTTPTTAGAFAPSEGLGALPAAGDDVSVFPTVTPPIGGIDNQPAGPWLLRPRAVAAALAANPEFDVQSQEYTGADPAATATDLIAVTLGQIRDSMVDEGWEFDGELEAVDQAWAEAIRRLPVADPRLTDCSVPELGTNPDVDADRIAVGALIRAAWRCEFMSAPILHTLLGATTTKDGDFTDVVPAGTGESLIVGEALDVAWAFSKLGTTACDNDAPVAGVFPLSAKVFATFADDADKAAGRCSRPANIRTAVKAFLAFEAVEPGTSVTIGDLTVDRTSVAGPWNVTFGGWASMPWALGDSAHRTALQTDGPDDGLPSAACVAAVDALLDNVEQVPEGPDVTALLVLPEPSPCETGADMWRQVVADAVGRVAEYSARAGVLTDGGAEGFDDVPAEDLDEHGHEHVDEPDPTTSTTTQPVPMLTVEEALARATTLSRVQRVAATMVAQTPAVFRAGIDPVPDRFAAANRRVVDAPTLSADTALSDYAVGVLKIAAAAGGVSGDDDRIDDFEPAEAAAGDELLADAEPRMVATVTAVRELRGIAGLGAAGGIAGSLTNPVGMGSPGTGGRLEQTARGPVYVCPAAGLTVHCDIAGQVEAMYAHAARDGIHLAGWAFRSYQRQIELRTINGCPNVFTARPSSCRTPTAIPGQSMHETGMAIDVTFGGSTIKSHSSPAFQWLARNAGMYGFRNLPSEPWHWSTTGG